MTPNENAQARFGINLESNAPAVSSASADALESLRKSITNSQTAIKAMSGDLRRLRGGSDDVKAAKEELKNKIDAEKNAVSAATLALLKQGASLEKATAATKGLASQSTKLGHELKGAGLKDAESSSSRLGAAIHAAGGPVEALASKMKGLAGAVGDAGGGLSGLATLAAGGLVGAILAVTGAVAGGVVAFGKWVIGAAGMNNRLALARAAALGFGKNAVALGTQVDALASKISTPKEELNDLAISLTKTRLSGQAIVDTFNAVGRASNALGNGAGDKLKDIITRGQLSGRIGINPAELLGTGVDFNAIAGELAAKMKIPLAKAQQALLEGRVKIDAGAAAIRAAVEKRFGEINAAKRLTLGDQVDKLKENLTSLAGGVDLGPLATQLANVFKLFDPNTVTGQAIKQLVDIIGNGLVKALASVGPYAKSFIEGMVVGAQELVKAYFDVKAKITETFGGLKLDGLVSLNDAVKAGKYLMYGIAAAVVVVGATIGALAFAVEEVLKPFKKLLDVGRQIRDDFNAKNWSGLGADAIKGLIDGLVPGGAQISDAVATLGKKAKDALKSELGIHSPSTVFAELGENTAQGFAQGIDEGSGAASSAAASMVAVPAAGGGGAGGGLSVTFQIDARGATKEAVDAMTNESFRQMLVEELKRFAASRGVLVQPFGTTPSILPVGTP